ncbi:MAG: hypothetical protein QG635_2095 [Bacteroidota bacterium]|nr:hypothetical protein [Bacteroidota bacterium]
MKINSLILTITLIFSLWLISAPAARALDCPPSCENACEWVDPPWGAMLASSLYYGDYNCFFLVHYKIRDLLGNEIFTQQFRKTSAEISLPFKSDNMASGLHYYQIITGGIIFEKGMFFVIH